MSVTSRIKAGPRKLLAQLKLSKLTIAAYRDTARTTKVGKPFEVQFNPESLSRHYETKFEKRKGLGPSSEGTWIFNKPSTLSMELVFDGTGVTHSGLGRLAGVPLHFAKGGTLQRRRLSGMSVADWVRKFLEYCQKVDSDTHEPRYLRLTWGDGPLQDGFDCRLASADVNYVNFNRDGSPQRAIVSAKFVEGTSSEKATALARLSSPDLTHRRVVKAGDTLPLLCIEIYGAAKHYLRVAQVNELDDFRALVPGTELIFPPFEQAEP